MAGLTEIGAVDGDVERPHLQPQTFKVSDT